MLKNTPRIGFLDFVKHLVHRCVDFRFFWFNGCTILAFMVLQKPHVWEKYFLKLYAKKLSTNQDAGFLNI